MSEQEFDVFLGVMELMDAKDVQSKLKKMGAEVHYVSNDKTCHSGGCKVTVELWGKTEHTEILKSFFQAEQMKAFKGHDINFENLSAVFDPSKDEVICQACGAKFKPSLNECPDCGLVYG